jgi:PEGA domain-containing protein
MLRGWRRTISSSRVERLRRRNLCDRPALRRVRMPLPPDTDFVSESTDSQEDPLGLFPSETQRAPSEIESQTFLSESQQPVPHPPARAVHTARRRFVAPTIALLVHVFAVLIEAARRGVGFAAASCALMASAVRRLRVPRWRLPAWHLPKLELRRLQLPRWHLPALQFPISRLLTWRPRVPAWHLPNWHVPGLRFRELRLPAWRSPAWRLPAWRTPTLRRATWNTREASVGSEARPFARQAVARRSISAVTLSAFACGVIAGGSAVWLSGTSRNAGAAATASAQPPLDGAQPAASPVASVGKTLAKTSVPGDKELPAPATTVSANTRRPLFRGSLVVNSRPSGARVFVNGRSVGRTPLVLRNQTAGSRAVRVALDGYVPWSSAVQVIADTETHLRAELKVQPPGAQP